MEQRRSVRLVAHVRFVPKADITTRRLGWGEDSSPAASQDTAQALVGFVRHTFLIRIKFPVSPPWSFWLARSAAYRTCVTAIVLSVVSGGRTNDGSSTVRR